MMERKVKKAKLISKPAVCTDQRKLSILDLPQETLVHIFSFYVKSEGLHRLLHSLKHVCPQWRDATRRPSLYRIVDCPNLSIRGLLMLGKTGCLRCTNEINLSYWAERWSKDDLKEVLSHCPELKRLDLSGNKVTSHLIEHICKSCPNLEFVKMEHVCGSTINKPVDTLLCAMGTNLTYLNLSNNTVLNSHNLLCKISESSPCLEEFHMTNMAGSVSFPIKKFQERCLRLRVLELGSCQYDCTGTAESGGFPNLESFLSGVVDENGPNDKELYLLLRESTKLKTLDIRGCKTTSESLMRIPADKLERLSLARSAVMRSRDLGQVIMKWSNTLKELDLSRCFDEDVINNALESLWANNVDPPLRELNLSVTNVTATVLKQVLLKCRDLHYLNIESCRYLPRGSRHTCRTRSEIEGLFELLQKI